MNNLDGPDSVGLGSSDEGKWKAQGPSEETQWIDTSMPRDEKLVMVGRAEEIAFRAIRRGVDKFGLGLANFGVPIELPESPTLEDGVSTLRVIAAGLRTFVDAHTKCFLRGSDAVPFLERCFAQPLDDDSAVVHPQYYTLKGAPPIAPSTSSDEVKTWRDFLKSLEGLAEYSPPTQQYIHVQRNREFGPMHIGEIEYVLKIVEALQRFSETGVVVGDAVVLNPEEFPGNISQVMVLGQKSDDSETTMWRGTLDELGCAGVPQDELDALTASLVEALSAESESNYKNFL